MQITRRLFVASVLTMIVAIPVHAMDVPELNLSRTGLALRGVDPVSYFVAGEPIQGRKTIIHEYNGGTYRFSSYDNLELFKDNPDAFLPAYGGYCAYRTAVKTKVDGDPFIWHIVDDQLYLNINRSVDRVWQRNVPKYLRDADKNWSAIKFK